MERVAEHLQKQAIQRVDAGEKDLFARSAYNRYYYATFLLARAMFRNLRTEWGALPHAAYPDILRGPIFKALDVERKKAYHLNDHELANKLSRGCAAARELAKIMELGYALRVTADYSPEISVIFSNPQRFALQNVSINDAHQWPPRSRALISTISAAWREI